MIIYLELDEQFNQLKQDYEALKKNASIATSTFVIPPQRFRPLDTENSTAKSLASLFKDTADKVGNIAKELHARMVPASLDAAGSNNNSSSTTTTVADQQNQPKAGQNVPPPPLAGQDQQNQQGDRVESAQAAPQGANPRKSSNDH